MHTKYVGSSDEEGDGDAPRQGLQLGNVVPAGPGVRQPADAQQPQQAPRNGAHLNGSLNGVQLNPADAAAEQQRPARKNVSPPCMKARIRQKRRDAPQPQPSATKAGSKRARGPPPAEQEGEEDMPFDFAVLDDREPADFQVKAGMHRIYKRQHTEQARQAQQQQQQQKQPSKARYWQQIPAPQQQQQDGEGEEEQEEDQDEGAEGEASQQHLPPLQQQQRTPLAAAAAGSGMSRHASQQPDAILDDLYAADEAERAAAAAVTARFAAIAEGPITPATVSLPVEVPGVTGAARLYPKLLQAAVRRHAAPPAAAAAAGGGGGRRGRGAAAAAAAATQAGGNEPAAAAAIPPAAAPSIVPAAAAGSQLHQELVSFAAHCLPRRDEVRCQAALLAALEAVVGRKWPAARVVPFGSQPTGLALPGSDMDVALLNIPGCPVAGICGHAIKSRKDVTKLLVALRSVLQAAGFVRKAKDLELVAQARVPLVKGQLSIWVPDMDNGSAAGGGGGRRSSLGLGGIRGAFLPPPSSGGGDSGPGQVYTCKVDICMGVTNGPTAVHFVVDKVCTLPPLRPLVLLIKALLKEANLNEVFTGGISSYSIFCLVLAHLQCEGAAQPTREAAPSSTDSILPSPRVLQHLADLTTQPTVEQAAGGWEAGVSWDYGVLLQGFFERYGRLFDFVTQAVTVVQGGVTPKPADWVPLSQARGAALAVQDPQQPQRNMIGGAAMRLLLLKDAFTWAADALAAAADHYAPAFNQQQQQERDALTAAAATAAGGAGPAAAAAGGGSSRLQRSPATWAAVQADGQHQSEPVPQAAAADAATAAAAAAAAAEELDLAGLQQQMPLLGEVLTLRAAVGRGPAADRLRKELRAAAQGPEGDGSGNAAAGGVSKAAAAKKRKREAAAAAAAEGAEAAEGLTKKQKKAIAKVEREKKAAAKLKAQQRSIGREARRAAAAAAVGLGPAAAAGGRQRGGHAAAAGGGGGGHAAGGDGGGGCKQQ